MNWFRSGNPKQMNQDQESIYNGFAAAVFATHSLEEAEALQKKNGVRKGDVVAKSSHSNAVTSRFSFKKTKNEGEKLMRQPTMKNSDAQEKNHSAARKPIRSLSDKPESLEDARRKAERNDKLKSIIAWANIKKMKDKHNLQIRKEQMHQQKKGK